MLEASQEDSVAKPAGSRGTANQQHNSYVGTLSASLFNVTFRLLRSPEFRIAAILTVGVLLASVSLKHLSELRYLRLHLGAENYNVARAIVDGRGYSDPFAEPTGPTAWVTPVYPLLLSALLYLLKDKSLVALTVVYLTNLSTIIVGTSIYSLARSFHCRIPPIVALTFYSVWVVAFTYWYFLVTSDIWLFTLIVQFMLVTLCQYFRTRVIRTWHWALLGGLATITIPAAALAWGCIFTSVVLKERTMRWRRLLMASSIVVVFLAPWTIRNAIVFHRFIPAKSNLGYELYQANVLDDDGVYSKQVFLKHPYASRDERFTYLALGENAYVRKRQDDFANYVAEQPAQFLRKVGFRALSATLFYVPLSPSQVAPIEVVELSVQRVVYPIPFVLLVCAIALGPRHSLARSLGILYLIYLVPYVIIAFYIRYLLPLTPLLVLSTYLGLERLYSHYLSSRYRDAHATLPTPK